MLRCSLLKLVILCSSQERHLIRRSLLKLVILFSRKTIATQITSHKNLCQIFILIGQHSRQTSKQNILPTVCFDLRTIVSSRYSYVEATYEFLLPPICHDRSHFQGEIELAVHTPFHRDITHDEIVNLTGMYNNMYICHNKLKRKPVASFI